MPGQDQIADAARNRADLIQCLTTIRPHTAKDVKGRGLVKRKTRDPVWPLDCDTECNASSIRVPHKVHALRRAVDGVDNAPRLVGQPKGSLFVPGRAFAAVDE